MKYAIDQIEVNIAILENINTKEKKEVNLKNLPPLIKEGMILNFTDSKYEIDKDEEQSRRKRIVDKFNKLKK